MPHDNIGYLSSALDVINSLDISLYSYICITNVDLTVELDFFQKLLDLTVQKDVAWIAPSIYSKQELRDKNPQRQYRCSSRKILALRFLYNIPILYNAYIKLIYCRKSKNASNANYEPGIKIYCGHGSFMIFTKAFFSSFSKIEWPCFLFCEELFLGELIRLTGLSVVYEPSLKIIDKEHVSTGALPGKNFFKYNKESLKFIWDKFYK